MQCLIPYAVNRSGKNILTLLCRPNRHRISWMYNANNVYHHLQPWSVNCSTNVLACCLQRSRFLDLMYQLTLPQYCCSSPFHLFRCLYRFLLPPMGVQTVSAALHLVSVLRLMWPAHVHFPFLIISIMSINLVWSLTHLLVFQSL